MPDTPKAKRINVRHPEIMSKVKGIVSSHYDSTLIAEITAAGNVYRAGNTEIHLASSFGFCDGVRRAIDLAYATREMFPRERIWLIGEIIHNPAVNAHMDALGLQRLPWRAQAPEYDQMQAGDVVIIPAFGVTVGMRKIFEERGLQIVDTTCGNVVRVWQKVKAYARKGITSIIHGKSKHEESMATASHSRGDACDGKFLIIFDERDAGHLAAYLRGELSREQFLTIFKGTYSVGFDPEIDLREIGMANQTTMLKDETARIQDILRVAITQRDGDASLFHVCDTICGATQDRQNALFELLDMNLDAMFIVGGYNSSNTTHLAHIAAERLPTFFVKSADCLLNLEEILNFDLDAKEEVLQKLPLEVSNIAQKWRIGITAGASCPANVIESVIKRILELRSA